MSNEQNPQGEDQSRMTVGQLIVRPDQIPGQIVKGTKDISNEIQFRLGIKDRQSALSTALEKGISPEQLMALGKIDERPDSGYRNQLKWAGVAIAAATSVAFIGENVVPKDIHLGAFVEQYFQAIIRDAGYTLPDDTLDQVVKGTGFLGVKYATILLGVVVAANAIKERLAFLDRRRKVYELRKDVDEKKVSGELSLQMNKGFVAIDLGAEGDAVGRTLGSRLGWGSNTLPLLEGSENHSGFDIWAKIPNPSDGIEKADFFKALDRIQFEKASTFVLCPVNHNQAFIPDVRNPDHFDLSFDEVVDRIRLIDEYCDLKGLPKKKVVVIGDGTIERAVRPYTGNGFSEIISTTLAETLKNIASERDTEILLADPTEIVLDKLASAEFNPNGYPVQFYEDPFVVSNYGQRLVERIEKREQMHEGSSDSHRKSLRVKRQDEVTDSLKVTYGIDDVATRETTSMLHPEDTLAIIVDEARAVGGPYKSLILSDIVSDWILDRL